MAGAKRTKKVERINLGDYSLDINPRKINYEKFDYREVDEYMRAIAGSRDYQYEAIKNVMTYLWGGSYKTVADLARENFDHKPHLQEKYGSVDILLNHIPLNDRLGGVVNMATGTGKSYVIFAVAYLSIIMGYVDRVLVLGPSSTVIEKGLNDKFRALMSDPAIVQTLPANLRNKAVDLLNDTDHITDSSITIENINAIFSFGGIIDSMKSSDSEWLVLSDEVHHAYSHLKFDNNKLALDKEVANSSKKRSAEDQERLWMKFLRENKQIARHIGFTGTPYNGDDYFADVIYNYSLKTAIDQRYIKEINPIISTGTEDGEEVKWTDEKRYEVILQGHKQISEKYSYKDLHGKPRLKPITIFICNTTAAANKKSEEFIKFLAKYEYSQLGNGASPSAFEDSMRERVICVTTAVSESEYKEKLENIEEIDPEKVGGAVEFIFAVNKLSEGWDVDNVFQIVPMQDKVFNSKLLISQVLGRGLRLPRNIPQASVLQNYPRVTIQNHEKFSEHIKEILDAVIESDMHLGTAPLLDPEVSERASRHFSLFNLNYLASRKLVDKEKEDQKTPQSLVLTKFAQTEKVKIEFDKSTGKYELVRKAFGIDAIVDSVYQRFAARQHEGIRFDFGTSSGDRLPSEDEIKAAILAAMEESKIENIGFLPEENKSQIELYFNQFLPRGTKKTVYENIEGDIKVIRTQDLPRVSLKVADLDRDGAIFFSEDYKNELGQETSLILEHLAEERTHNKINEKQQILSFSDPLKLLGTHSDYVRSLTEEDSRPPYIVNPTFFKTPQSGVVVSHSPEKLFTFKLLENSAYIYSFIKSPDKGFYSLNYEYWKKGKDRTVRAFNPDFFILIKIDEYITKLRQNGVDTTELKKLQDKQYEYIVKAVEIKSDNDEDETISPKAKAGKEHFESLNKRLSDANPQDFDEDSKKFQYSYYTFDLLRESEFNSFFRDLKSGIL